jgi:hypothetical protein
MPVFKNVSEVLAYIGSDDAEFQTLIRPQGFNHWSDAKKQLEEDNPSFFAERGEIPVDCDIGILMSRQHHRGFMVILPGSRYVVTNWVKNLTHPRPPVALPGVLGASIRIAHKDGL